ncbi:TetR family transcriptional regulator [Rhodanobacter sp. MP7CTX1]|uniref:TetR/AcrR family transcriptional regulator n=1 Tax=Rhodanobacter sp. MP7CTX1 TaxID=2723084 RepID=UPI001833A7BA|nr:TetR family transcriptional regulator [Rhodanobacter sp. MP7CTX1]MBB6185963.1 AcrR family transcriptional regulator [Rhodanobacter sp. MP7CTX1]
MKPESAMQDRREIIIEAGLATLREHGFVGFTQPRVAQLAGLRQSHLTYYYPTRLDLLTAVARAAIDRQLGAADKVLGGTTRQVAQAMSKTVVHHEDTRVMMALAQAADQEAPLRELFRELADAIVGRSSQFLKSLNNESTVEDARLLHALLVGLAVVDLATGRPDGAKRTTAVLDRALKLLLSS